MRVNPDLWRDIVAALNHVRDQQNGYLEQFASGRRLNYLSEDPASAAALVEIHSRISQADEYLATVTQLRETAQMADSTLSAVMGALTRAITLGVQGATGTLSQDNREALAEEVKGVQAQVLSLANLNFQGTYVFAGTNVTTKPFVADVGDPMNVTYQGNDGVRQAEVSESVSLAVNIPGSDLFMDPDTGVFAALDRLVSALQSGTDIEAATNDLRQAFDHVNTLRVSYGDTLKRLDTAEAFLKNETTAFKSRENDLAGADLSAVASELMQAEQSRSALLSAAGKISQLSLFDYLR